MKKLSKAIDSVSQIEFYIEYCYDNNPVIVKKLFANDTKDAVKKARKKIGKEAFILSVSAV